VEWLYKLALNSTWVIVIYRKEAFLSMDSQVMVALALSLVGGLSTSIGKLYIKLATFYVFL
jgi:hypothetical protein